MFRLPTTLPDDPDKLIALLQKHQREIDALQQTLTRKHKTLAQRDKTLAQRDKSLIKKDDTIRQLE
jgi:Skp family chaperone for outer membrane proteins